MADSKRRPRPGDKGYSGPVPETFGRPVLNATDDLNAFLERHLANARNLPNEVNRRGSKAVAEHEANARSLLGDIGTNLFGGGTSARDAKKARAAKVAKAKANARSRAMSSRTGPNVGKAPTKAVPKPKVSKPAKRTKKQVKRTNKLVNKKRRAIAKTAAKTQAKQARGKLPVSEPTAKKTYKSVRRPGMV
jgi:hypothetical protein